MKRNTLLIIFLIIIIALICLGIICYRNKIIFFNKIDEMNEIINNNMNNTKDYQDISKLKIEILKRGKTGEKISFGQTAIVHYTGWLADGKKFDSSVDRNEPFKFVLDTGMVIAGWDRGVAGMEIGEKRKLIIPPDLAYGEQGIPGLIPSNAVLIFEVELLDIE